MKKILTGVLFLVLIILLLSCSKNEDEIINKDIKEINETSGENDLSLTEIENSENTSEIDNKENTDNTNKVYVYVCGEVVNPGVYEMSSGDRVSYAIEKAGGVKNEAYIEYLNLAKIVQDEEKIYVPSREEVLSNSENINNNGENFGVDFNTSNNENNKININKASKEELMTLSGIGESKANLIIKYREENGKFSKIEDIMNISGIKEGMFNKIKDDITV